MYVVGAMRPGDEISFAPYQESRPLPKSASMCSVDDASVSEQHKRMTLTRVTCSQMGMWHTSKEIPGPTLAKLLERPWDQTFVDDLLFTDAGDWSDEASRTDLPGDVLLARFDFGPIPMSVDEMLTLGELDGGDFDSSVEELPVFPCLLMTAAAERGDDLRFLLELSNGARDWDSARSELAARFDLSPPKVSSNISWTTPEGEKRYGFASAVPCYGINAFTTVDQLKATWLTLRRVIELHPQQRDALLGAFGKELKYYYGCAMRESAELWVIW